MAFIPEDVLNKNFTATQFRRGYDEHEVDDFLDEIVAEMRRLVSENDDLSTQLTTCLEDRGVIPPEARDRVTAATVSAEQAEAECAERIAAAHAEAEQAQAQAAELVSAENDSVARIAEANAAAERAEALAAERMRSAQETADELAAAAFAVVAEQSPSGGVSLAKDAEQDSGEVLGTALSSAAGVLALAEKVHTEYVAEGRQARERLIGEGQLRHDQLVEEAMTKQDNLLGTAHTQHEALLAEANALLAEAGTQHEQLITQARESANGMVTGAQHKRTEVLEALGHERNLLQKRIDELRTFERDYRARLKSHLEEQLHELAQGGGAVETVDVGTAEAEVAEVDPTGADTAVGNAAVGERDAIQNNGQRHDG